MDLHGCTKKIIFIIESSLKGYTPPPRTIDLAKEILEELGGLEKIEHSLIGGLQGKFKPNFNVNNIKCRLENLGLRIRWWRED